MIHLNPHLSKRNEDVNEVDDSFEHTLIKEKWRCKWSRWFIWTHTRWLFEHTLRRNEDVNEVDDSFEHTLIKNLRNENVNVNEVDDSFEHTLIKEKWRCKWSRWFIWTHTYQREMKM